MEVFENENKVSDITLIDFPLICRICLKPSDLQLFKEVDYLLDVFLTLTNIDVRSTGNLPRNVCNDCINELKDISLFIDISKYNAAARQEKNLILKRENENLALSTCETSQNSILLSEETIEEEGGIYIQGLEMCRICFSTSCLTPIEEKAHLMQLFQNITNIDVEAETNFSKRNSICAKCINKLEKIFLFISLSFYNDMKLKKTVGGNEDLEPEDRLEDDSKDVKFEIISGTAEVIVENNFGENAFSYESKSLHEVVDIKEYCYRPEAPERQNTQNGMVFCSETNSIEKPLKCDPSENEFGTDNCLEMIPKVLKSQFENEFECDGCKKKFNRRSNLKRHMCTHTSQKPFKCGCCKKSFAYKYELKSHVLIHTGERPFKCDCYEKTFISKGNLQQHMLIHSGKGRSNVIAAKKKFTHKSFLQRHILIHSRERPFKCDCCKKTFNNKSTVQKHMLIHSGEKPFKCNVCEKRFNVKGNLQQHMVIHSGERPFKCDCCEKTFNLKGNLQQHMLIHSGKRLFKCDGCEKKFTHKCNLQQHMLIHSRERPFKCVCCKKSFNTKNNLQKHMLIHSGEKPFKCDCCGKKFTRKSHLQQHMLIHSGEKPFKCDCCEKKSLRCTV